ncbi:MAG TPA: zinc ribbon domain-containing protein [Vicinamibacterales bacterium]|nr:zinc ribbon domain-containing protein [Vicinamibacterales bacterium]
MPIYDYRCRTCGAEFELIVRSQDTPSCPACQSVELDRQPSTFAVSSRDKTRAAADAKNKKAASTARADTAAMDREIEKHRLEDH